MARGYYGTNGAEVLNSAVIKGYAKGLNKVSSYQSPTPGQAFIIFLIGLPVMPLWSAICVIMTKHKMMKWEKDYPEEAQRLATYLFIYKCCFMLGIVLYALVLFIAS